MGVCQACDKSIPADARSCPYCGNALTGDATGDDQRTSHLDDANLGKTVDSATDATVTTPGPSADTPTLRHCEPDLSISDVHGRFLPGTALTERYRIVGLLGKGGMGEVYRADDLELNQSVALKFLPAHFTQDTARLQRFRGEVRMARQVSHPNVCRVYDIATYGDDVFLSMEYIDGEDLSSVLRRMGRPSEEKAIEWARQICLGLGAAHENRVLHRDLKPANVMIDGRGRARLTDFGLAGVEEEFTGRKDHAGTPAYMAPEQLVDGETTIKSDIYSLGLLLYELFTGKRMFEAESLDELMRLRRSDTITTPTSVSGQIDPAIERAILRCLERDPSRRPTSTYEVLAALPGGDPLQAALAAGETPSPQMVANSGKEGSLRPVHALSCLLVFLVLAIASVPLTTLIWHEVPLEKPPAVLAEKARTLVASLGYHEFALEEAFGFTQSESKFSAPNTKVRFSDLEITQLREHRPPAIHFWFRNSPDMIVPLSTKARITVHDPPMTVPGMVTVLLDPRGRLDKLTAVPPQHDDTATTTTTTTTIKQDTNWTTLFEAAGLDITNFEVAASEWTPPAFADERRAWVGSYPDFPGTKIRIEAAAYRGTPTFFHVMDATAKNTVASSAGMPTGFGIQIIMPAFIILVVTTGVWMARRNIRLQRVDRTGANRFAIVLLAAGCVAFILTTDHSTSMAVEVEKMMVNVALAMFAAGVMWLFYLALEPYVRRRWPETLITWTRIFSGKVRDPRVGRDILIGGIIGLLQHFIFEGKLIAEAHFFGIPIPFNHFRSYHTFLGGRFLIGEFFMPYVVTLPIVVLMALFVFRLILRRDWAAAAFFVALTCLPEFLSDWSEHGPVVGLLQLAASITDRLLFIFLMFRFGLFAAVAAVFIHEIYHRFPITLDPGDWYFNIGLVPLMVVAGLGIYGFFTSLGGQSLVKDGVLDG